jgi:hypothetical protein
MNIFFAGSSLPGFTAPHGNIGVYSQNLGHGRQSVKDNMKVLDSIPVDVDVPSVLKAMKASAANKRMEADLPELIERVKQVIRPRVMYAVSQVTEVGGNRVEVEGVAFTHHVPSLNFSEGERVFPYVATCGLEIEELKYPGSVMKDYCLNMIKNVVLMRAGNYFKDYLKNTYLLQELSRIGPGEAMGDVSQQHKLFSLLGDVESAIGVRLSAHNMMVPEKSTSGIYFETAIGIESCQLCPNRCRARRAPYDPDLLKTFRKDVRPPESRPGI